MENNRYFQGVQDDQLKEYRIDKRNKVLDEVMIKYAGTASDLVQKRDQLIKEGYTMPGESVDSFTKKLAGLDKRKNLWKMFKRMIVRKRAAFVKRTKDIWHGRGKRPLTKAEKEMLLKEVRECGARSEVTIWQGRGHWEIWLVAITFSSLTSL